VEINHSCKLTRPYSKSGKISRLRGHPHFYTLPVVKYFFSSEI
jgi:hypothetical protein